MRCEQTTEHFSAYIEGDLQPGMRLNVEQHLEECEECRNTLASLGEVFAALHAADLAVEPPGAFADNVMRTIRLQQRASRKTLRGWFGSLNRGWQGGIVGVTALAAVAVFTALGPLQEGLPAGFLHWVHGSGATRQAGPSSVLSVTGSSAGFRNIGTPDDLIVNVSARANGHWKLAVQPGNGLTVADNAAADPNGGYVAWEGDLPAGSNQQIPVTLVSQGRGVHEVSLRLLGREAADSTAVSVLVPIALGEPTGATLDWTTVSRMTMRQALTELAGRMGRPICVPSDVLDQPVTVNAAAMRPDDLIDAIAASASLKADHGSGACNIHR